MTKNAKVSGALIASFVVIVALLAILAGGNGSGSDDRRTPDGEQTAPVSDAAAATLPPVVGRDPRRLGARGRTSVTLTEFLDFECEGCRAAFPVVERLRKVYAGRVTFNIRYFPIPSHRNSRTAATAVEAASKQGKLEAMYKKMYETQSAWGEKSESQAARFRGFAKELGLDMRRYDAAVADPATLRRIERDFAAGAALGVQGTPTFFVNERKIEPRSLDDLANEIDVALAGS